MKAWAVVIAAVVVAGCGGTNTDDQIAQIDDVHFAAPYGWAHRDSRDVSRAVSEWTPPANDAKESITIIRTTLRGDVRHADAAALTAMLTSAQRALPAGHFGSATKWRTPTGLSALIVDGSFQPSGQRSRYRRVHALVIDGDAIVHVLYTARTPDPDLRNFHIVLDSLRREQG